MKRAWVGGVAACLLAVSCAGVAAQQERKRERRQEERLEELARKLARRQAQAGATPEHRFLHARAAAILERARQTRDDAYVFDRLVRAADDLLEASEELFEARQPEPPPTEAEQRETALDLQRCYFRVRQADYFAEMSREPEAGLYVQHARSLYQQARSAYDGRQYRRAGKLGEAAEEIVSALEKLAQAAVRIPEPPKLE
ncbi:MAG: hypothetical protein RMK57_10570 [Bryobacterales bacterium]|nr:hypothetical protein [Bryobacteraceae bacterium]MDW8354960.1 hypothetical protein [Bryobacterales bacterium]